MAPDAMTYCDCADDTTPHQLDALHIGWPGPPSSKALVKSLRNMNAVVLALDNSTDKVVGFICGMTDRTLILCIWDHEVLPEYQDQGTEEKMSQRLLDKHGDIYQVNTIIMPEKRKALQSAGFPARDAETNGLAMTRMRLAWQDGGPRAEV